MQRYFVILSYEMSSTFYHEHVRLIFNNNKITVSIFNEFKLLPIIDYTGNIVKSFSFRFLKKLYHIVIEYKEVMDSKR